MPLHNGIIVSAAVKYRFIIAVLLMYILYSHWSYNNDLFSVIEKAEKDLTSCQYHAESLVAKLRVIYDYKTKMEKMFNTKRENWQLKYASINRQRQNCEESLLAAGEDLEKCKSGRRDQIPLPQSPEKVQLAQLQEEVRTLKTTNLSLNEALLKREESLRTCDEELSKAKSSLSVCNEMVEKYAGGKHSSVQHVR
ncbi:hypothetical protein Q1695_012135 [Nippostrongylus brasiliensis]|nr:hypothetical protein Q1695_012135 [Nippostrongylus brasiliensis]